MDDEPHHDEGDAEEDAEGCQRILRAVAKVVVAGAAIDHHPGDALVSACRELVVVAPTCPRNAPARPLVTLERETHRVCGT